MSSIFSLFNILAILYIFRTAQLSITLWREWPEFQSEPLTAHKKSLANQASFFIAVPIAVFVHEAAHALAVLLTGGEVLEFQYRVFWGYVVPGGTFSDAQMFFIAIAGTLGSLLVGLLFWLATRQAASSSLRYFGLRAVRFQIYFSLIYYPVFTLLGFNGDWRTIYDFSSTPILSGVTAAAHGIILFLFWRFDRQGWFEAPAFATEADQQRYEQLAEQAAANPENVALQLQVIDIERRGGATHTAQRKLDALLQAHPDSGVAHLESAALKSSGKSSVPKDAVAEAQQAIDLGLANPLQIAFAYELIGRSQVERGALDDAEESLSRALSATRESGSEAAAVEPLVLRSQVFRRQGSSYAAYQDLQEALTIAQREGLESRVQEIEGELEVLAKHSGQSYLAPTSEKFD